MKRKYLLIAALAAVCISAAGCDAMGKNESAATEATETAADTAEETSGEGNLVDELTIAGKDSAKTIYLSDIMARTYESGEEDGGSSYNEQYELVCLDDTNAVLVDAIKYSDSYKSFLKYVGTYELAEETTIMFKSSEPELPTAYNLTLDGDKISDVQVGDTISYATIEGSYSGNVEGYGDVTLTVKKTGEASLTTADGNEYTGNIIDYNGDWDFMASIDESTSIDWIVTFEGNTFSCINYTEKVYGKFEGTYTINGDLGEIVVNVDKNGNASATIVVNGEEKEVSGSVYQSYEGEGIGGFYLSSYDGYSFDISVETLEDGTMNYSGSMTTPLNAG
jgi:predicted small secreted protein